MKTAFNWNIDQYIFFGGYPRAIDLVADEQRWTNYVHDSLIETTISRDILLMTRVDKPALLRRLFELGCQYSGQILSYQKMLCQLRDVGNTTTLAHYLNLLSNAGLIMGLSKYSGKSLRQRGSSPKLCVMNTALMTVMSHLSFSESRKDSEFWGRLTESAVGASLANAIKGKNIGLYYWLERNREVDFILTKGKNLVAIEVKSGKRRDNLPGISLFSRCFKIIKKLLVGADGIPVDKFLALDPEDLFQQ